MHVSAPLRALLGLLPRRGGGVPVLVDAAVLRLADRVLPGRLGHRADLPPGHDTRHIGVFAREE